jgi:Kef-type K+ transport system membrane component KefB
LKHGTGLEGWRSHRLAKVVAAYLLMSAATAAIILVVRKYGDTLVAGSPSAGPAGSSESPSDWLLHLLIALAAIILLGNILAKLFAHIHQPPVIGQVVAGILLGPSLLGLRFSGWIVPESVAPHLAAVAQLGIVLYMFMVGLELNPSLLKNRGHAVLVISHASMLLPFVLGVVLALVLYPRLAPNDVGFTSFNLFMGVAMSITAFPVLARILSDHHLTKTKLGVLALGCAAVGDFTAWCLLAFVVGVVKAKAGTGIVVIIEALVYISFTFFAVRPFLTRLIGRWEQEGRSGSLFVSLILLMLASAAATEAIGIHAIFGAFLAGAIIPHDSAVARRLTGQLKGVVMTVLLPAFFAFAGLQTRIDLLSSWSLWLMFLLVFAVAVVGKFGGTYAASRLTGLGRRGAAMLSALMNTRGLMELIVLSVGLNLGVIGPELYTIMVLMALATTALTSPVLHLLVRRATPAESEELLTERQRP